MQVCEAVAAYREDVGVTAFFELSKARGLGSSASYVLFLNGQAPDGSSISRTDYMRRGATLEMLRGEWLSMWLSS